MIQVLLRKATTDDLELMLAWRNSPLVWQGLYTQSKENRPLTWEEHHKWWNSRHNWKIFIIQVNDTITTRDIGVVSFSQLDSWCPSVGIYIGEVSLWGKGIGKQGLLLALDWLKGEEYSAVWTTILSNNERSIKLFQSLGFQKVFQAREGEDTYILKLDNFKKGI